MAAEAPVNPGSKSEGKAINEFPGSPEERREAIFASFNGSLKAVTMLLLSTHMIDPVSLARKFKGAIAGSEMAKSRYDAASIYCHETLCPIGLVAEEIAMEAFGTEKTVGFATTEAGEKYGKPLAALFLQFEMDHNFSLFPILGQTQKSHGEHRAPYTRVRILDFLKDGVKRSEIDIIKHLGITAQPTARNSLLALNQAGVIQYSSLQAATGKEQLEYSLGTTDIKEIKSVPHNITLTSEIAAACMELKQNDIPISQDRVYKLLKGGITRSEMDERNLRHHINVVLHDLVDQNFLKQGKYVGAKIGSEAIITPKGLLVTESLISQVYRGLEDETFLDRLRKTALRMVERELPKFAANSARLYWPYSRAFHAKEFYERRAQCLEVLTNNQERKLTAREIAHQLGLKTDWVRRQFKTFIKSGVVTSERTKEVDYYSLTNRHDDNEVQ